MTHRPAASVSPSPALRFTRVAAWVWPLAAAVLTLGAGGCWNPLAPSEPEPPSAEEGTIEVNADYATTEGLLGTLADAVAARDRPGNGRAAYMGAFAGGAEGLPLAFQFDAAVIDDRVQAGVPIPTWSRQFEQQFYVYLSSLKPTLERVMVWSDYDNSPPDAIDETAGTATVYTQYKVITISPDGADSSLAIGRAELSMRKASSRWFITNWKDTVDPAAGADPADIGLRSFSRLRIDTNSGP